MKLSNRLWMKDGMYLSNVFLILTDAAFCLRLTGIHKFVCTYTLYLHMPCYKHTGTKRVIAFCYSCLWWYCFMGRGGSTFWRIWSEHHSSGFEMIDHLLGDSNRNFISDALSYGFHMCRLLTGKYKGICSSLENMFNPSGYMIV